MPAGKERFAAASLVLSSLLTVVKGAVAAITGSLSAWTETLDSLLDIVNVGMGLGAMRVSRKPPDRDHAYGHGKVESLVAYTEAVFIGTIIGAVVLESVRRIYDPPVINMPVLGASLMVLTLIADIGLAWLNYKGAVVYRSSILRANYLNYLGDVVRTVIVIAALYAAALGMHIIDILTTFVLSAVLAREAFKLAMETTDVLLDKMPVDLEREIMSAVSTVRGVKGVRRIRGRLVGDRVFLDVIIEVEPSLSIEEAHSISSMVEYEIARRLGESDVLVHVEPRKRKAG